METLSGHAVPGSAGQLQLVIPQRNMKFGRVESALEQFRFALHCRRSSTRKANVLNPVGMVPVRLSHEACSSCRKVMLPTQVGIGPVSRVLLSM